MGSCLPSLGGGVVADGVLVEVGITVVMLEGVVDCPVKRMTFIGGRGVTVRRILRCRYLPSTPRSLSQSLTYPSDIINNYSMSFHWISYCPVSYEAFSAVLVLTIFIKS